MNRIIKRVALTLAIATAFASGCALMIWIASHPVGFVALLAILFLAVGYGISEKYV